MGPRVLTWKGSGPLPEIPDINYAVYMLDIFRGHGHDMATVDAESGIGRTYSEICALVPRVSGGLLEAGVRPDHRVLLLLPTHSDYALLLLSILYCGAVCVPVNPSLGPEELVHALKVSEASWALVHEASAPLLEAARQKLPRETIKGVWNVGTATPTTTTSTPTLDHLAAHKPIQPIAKVSEGVGRWVGMMPFSSGTTGLPKGVLISHQALLINQIRSAFQNRIRASEGKMAITPRDIHRAQLMVVPVCHLYGHAMFMASLQVGGTIYCLKKFSPRAYFEAIQKYKITFSSLVPHMIKFVSETPLRKQYDTSSIIAFFNSGAPLPPATVKAVREKVQRGLGSSYGMTEAYSAFTTHSTESLIKYPTSVGFVIPYITIKVVDIKSGEMVGEGVEGEVCVSSPGVMLGYANNPSATAAALDDDGWLHTGDIGYYDHQDLLYITDRLKDLIKVKGHQVAPTELENLLKQHPDVGDAAVVGVEDDRTGEAPRAYVVPKHNHNINTQQILDFVAERMATYKHLRGGVIQVKTIPRNPTGKVIRRKLFNTTPSPPQAKL